MLNKLSNRLQGWAKGWLVLVLFLLDVAFVAFIMPIAEALIKGDQGGPGPLDLQFFYTPGKAYRMIDAYGPYTRIFYRNIELTLDIIYPIVYTLFFSLLITWLFKKGFPANSSIQRSNVLPFGAWIFDLLENIGIITMLSVHPATPEGVAVLTSMFTTIKWLFVAASLALVVIGIFAAIGSIFRKGQLQQT